MENIENNEEEFTPQERNEIISKAQSFLDKDNLNEKGESDAEEDDEIKEIQKELEEIPSDTPKVELMEKLSLVFVMLCDIERITAEMFILYNIKEHFKITKEDAKKYITHLNSLRKQLSGHKKEEKAENHLPLILDRDIDSGEVLDAILEIGIIDKKTLHIIIAIAISAQLRLNPPLWLFLIGVPSSFKTEFVGLLGDMKEVFTLDTLTENAFASGFIPPDGSDPQDLLPLLDNRCFIIKDLNTIFSMNEDMVKKILGDLTSIFDGKFEKFTATRGMIQYNSLFSMIGCITPSILIKHYNYATQLGPRFLFLRLPELTDEEMQKGFNKSWNETDRRKKIIETRQLVSSYCTQLIKKIKQFKNNPETNEIKKKINNIARFICNARGIAISGRSTFKNDAGNEVDYYEIKDWQVEHPWRILNQLKSLLTILSFINGKNNIDEEIINIIRPIILSTMPVDRSQVLNVLASKCGLSARDISKEIRKSSKTIRRILKELEALNIVDCYKDSKAGASGEAPWLYYIVPEFASVLEAPIPPTEFMSQSRSHIKETGESYNKEEIEEDLVDLANYLNPDRKKHEDGIEVPSNPFKKEPPDIKELPF
ncbi:MAG TPA: winged helix-turn-helix domain-containing protein [Candidatus Paceibacterota bacterium]|nr:winged helix-turn-helix domain-containing protein [Candidatus Paceibacterota bacterium]